MLSWRLADEFVAKYANRPVEWGFVDASGVNSLGELTFLQSYSRLRPDGGKERWYEVCRRVVEGLYSILRDHCRSNRLPWDEAAMHRSAEDAYERLFTMKWTPPGRGLWLMGTPFIHERRDGAGLNNCAFVSTADMTARQPERPFRFLMEASMLGVGVGFDTDGARRGIRIRSPEGLMACRIPDSREGWGQSVGLLLRAFLAPNQPLPIFDYSGIRPAGARIGGFGGLAPGPAPLQELHQTLQKLLTGRTGELLGSRDIVDVGNLIGRCVAVGNVRRSAEIALGHPDDEEFLNLKNYETNPERALWGWASNNSLKVEVGQDYDAFIERVVDNGEPGLVYMDLTRHYGRLADPPDGRDHRVAGTNPCAEQSLESSECCCLVETFPTRCADKRDFLRTLRHAFLYAKAVTLLPTQWPETNAIMQRNRRIGCSVSGMAQFVETRGWAELRSWLDDGYAEVRRWDRLCSEWLGVRESIKTTSVKPSGSVSLVTGVTPGAHWPSAPTYIRRLRLGANSPLTLALEEAGYHTEPAFEDPARTVVVEMPIRGPKVRSEREVSIFEKLNLAILLQRHWADNAVSVTVSFDRATEGEQIGSVLRMHEGQLKAVSFLPLGDDAYPQMPYETVTPEQYEMIVSRRKPNPLDWDRLYDRAGVDAVGEDACESDRCSVPTGADRVSACP
jgi:ribonucleoside-triphosphate reductase